MEIVAAFSVLIITPPLQDANLIPDTVTADGDAAIEGHVAAAFGNDVLVNRDPNHYAKGLLKNVLALGGDYPVIKELAMPLKKHFLVGMFTS